ncbi:MAG: hypothetical protein ACR2N2_00255 [Acidimicrobiia bacterium]
MIRTIAESFRTTAWRRMALDFTGIDLGLDMRDIVADLDWSGGAPDTRHAGARDVA